MRVAPLAAGFLVAVLSLGGPRPAAAQDVLVFPGANSRETWFSIHNLRAAHELTGGTGARVGILDHSFAVDSLPELYAGGACFQAGEWVDAYRTRAHHGAWMARALKEVAPDAEVYALGTYHPDEGVRVDAMIEALDWAVEHAMDAVTYSARGFSAEARQKLDSAVQRAVDAGVTVVFIHYPHPDNLLPSWIGPRSGDDERDPDVNIFHYDYSVLFLQPYVALTRGEDARGYRPFLSLSSTAPVTAGMVALMKSLDPTLTPGDVKEILIQASRPLTVDGSTGLRVPDALRALEIVRRRRAGP